MIILRPINASDCECDVAPSEGAAKCGGYDLTAFKYMRIFWSEDSGAKLSGTEVLRN